MSPLRKLAGLLTTEAVVYLVDEVRDEGVKDAFARLLSRLVDVEAAAEQSKKKAQP